MFICEAENECFVILCVYRLKKAALIEVSVIVSHKYSLQTSQEKVFVRIKSLVFTLNLLRLLQIEFPDFYDSFNVLYSKIFVQLIVFRRHETFRKAEFRHSLREFQQICFSHNKELNHFYF